MNEIELDLTDLMYLILVYSIAMYDLTIVTRNSCGKGQIAYQYYVQNRFGLFNVVFDELLYIVFMTMKNDNASPKKSSNGTSWCTAHDI